MSSEESTSSALEYASAASVEDTENDSKTSQSRPPVEGETPEERKMRRQELRQKRLMSQLYMSDSEFEVEEADLHRAERATRKKKRIDYNENKRKEAAAMPETKKRTRRKSRKLRESQAASGAVSVPKRRGRPPKRRGRWPKKEPEVEEDSPSDRSDSRQRLTKSEEAIQNHYRRREKAREKKVAALKEVEPLDSYLEQILAQTSVDTIENIAHQTNMPARWQQVIKGDADAAKILGISANTSNEELDGWQSMIADCYYKLAKEFANARVSRLDELIKVIDTCVDKAKGDFTKYKTRQETYRQRYSESIQKDAKKSTELLDKMLDRRLPNRLPKVIFPEFFDRQLNPMYEEMRQLKSEARYKFDMVDTVTDANKDILQDQLNRALLENRTNVQLQAIKDLDLLNRQFSAATGINLTQLPEEPQPDDDPTARDHLLHRHYDNTLEGLADASADQNV